MSGRIRSTPGLSGQETTHRAVDNQQSAQVFETVMLWPISLMPPSAIRNLPEVRGPGGGKGYIHFWANSLAHLRSPSTECRAHVGGQRVDRPGVRPLGQLGITDVDALQPQARSDNVTPPRRLIALASGDRNVDLAGGGDIPRTEGGQHSKLPGCQVGNHADEARGVYGQPGQVDGVVAE